MRGSAPRLAPTAAAPPARGRTHRRCRANPPATSPARGCQRRRARAARAARGPGPPRPPARYARTAAVCPAAGADPDLRQPIRQADLKVRLYVQTDLQVPPGRVGLHVEADLQVRLGVRVRPGISGDRPRASSATTG